MLFKKTVLALAAVAAIGTASVATSSTAALAWDGGGWGGGWGGGYGHHHHDHYWGGGWGGYCHWEQRPVKIWTNWGFDWRYQSVKICGY